MNVAMVPSVTVWSVGLDIKLGATVRKRCNKGYLGQVFDLYVNK